MDLVGHGADLQAVQVGHGGDVLVIGSHIAEAVLPEGQALQAVAGEAVQNRLAGLAVEAHLIDLLLVQEHVGDVIQVEVVVGSGHGRGGAHGDVALAGLGHREGLLVVAQLVVGEVGDLDGAVGVLLHLGDKHLGHSVLGAGGGNVAHTQLDDRAGVPAAVASAAGIAAVSAIAAVVAAGRQREEHGSGQKCGHNFLFHNLSS